MALLFLNIDDFLYTQISEFIFQKNEMSSCTLIIPIQGDLKRFVSLLLKSLNMIMNSSNGMKRSCFFVPE